MQSEFTLHRCSDKSALVVDKSQELLEKLLEVQESNMELGSCGQNAGKGPLVSKMILELLQSKSAINWQLAFTNWNYISHMKCGRGSGSDLPEMTKENTTKQ